MTGQQQIMNSFSLGREQGNAIERFSGEQKQSPALTFLSTFQVLVSLYTNQRDFQVQIHHESLGKEQRYQVELSLDFTFQNWSQAQIDGCFQQQNPEDLPKNSSINLAFHYCETIDPEIAWFHSGESPADALLYIEKGENGFVGFLDVALDGIPEIEKNDLAQHFQNLLVKFVQNPESPLSECSLL